MKEIQNIKDKLIHSETISFLSESDMINLKFIKSRDIYTIEVGLEEKYNVSKMKLDKILRMLNETQSLYTYLYDYDKETLVIKTNIWAKDQQSQDDIRQVSEEMVSIAKSVNKIIKETANG